MNLIAIAAQQLRLNQALPYDLRGADGQLLLAADTAIADPRRLAELQAIALYAEKPGAGAAAAAKPPTLALQWGAVAAMLDRALRDLQPDTGWLARLMAARQRAIDLSADRPDAALYHFVYAAGHHTERYSSMHGLLCMLICRETAATLGWDASLVNSLEQAALTMNCAMHKLQDELAALDPPVTPELRAAIREHPVRSAQRLEDAGVADPLWTAIVRLHHDDSLKARPLDELTTEQRAARLLNRVDVFTAKLSRRKNRAPMSPVQAAREACLGADGLPDEIGAALLKSVGMYPPGSFVRLASDEVGVVVSRGPRANLPQVVVLVDAAGAPARQLLRRDTGELRYAVAGAVPGSSVKVVPPHDLLMNLR